MFAYASALTPELAANQNTAWLQNFGCRHTFVNTMSTPNQPNTPSNLSFQSIPFTQSTNDNISSVGLASPVELATTTPQRPSFLSSGIPKTPEQVVVAVNNSEDVDEDYDTDNEIGPFYDQVVDEGELVEVEEQLYSAPVTISTSTTTTGNTPSIPP